MKRVKDAFYRRVFLNRPRYQAGAYFLGYVRGGYGIDANMTIADCNRQINLEFGAHDGASARNNLRKARTLQAAVTDFADTYAQMVEDKKWAAR